MMSLWDALRMNMMISYQELVRTFLNNKMPYHVTLGYIGTNGITMLPQTQSLMVTPYSHADTQFKNVPSAFQVGYINDFGGLSFYEINCPTVNNSCNVSVAKRDK